MPPIPKLDDILDRQLLDAHIAARHVGVQRHPVLPLRILNYAKVVQYDRLWDDVTRACRGLIVDDDDNVLARPWPKFFNLEEHTSGVVAGPLPFERTDFLATEKVDGSLIIVCNWAGMAVVASRGSFISTQAQHAAELYKVGPSGVGPLVPAEGTAYLFEVVYPANRIVIDYEGRDELVLLGATVSATGADVPRDEFGLIPNLWRYPWAYQHYVEDLDELVALGKEMDTGNSEGFVVAWHLDDQPAIRVKMKLAEYLRLHAIVTRISNVVIWEYLASGRDLAELLDRVPDEFDRWVRATAEGLRAAASVIVKVATDEMNAMPARTMTRKEQAAIIMGHTYPAVSFLLLDGRDPWTSRQGTKPPLPWGMVRPTWTRPFVEDEG